MIRAENGKLEIRGSREEVSQEFMMIVSQMNKLSVFNDIDDLMMATMFAASDEKKQREMLKEMLDSMFAWMKEEMKK